MSVILAIAALTSAIPAETVKNESRLALANYGDCIIERKGEMAKSLLARPYDDRLSKESRQLNDAACRFAGPTITFDQRLVRNPDGLQLRSVLFQALLRRDSRRVGMTPPVANPARFPIGRNWPGSPAMNYLRMIEAGRCLLTRDPGGARALVLSSVNSPAETAALNALAKPFGQCGLRGDEKFTARGALAEIYYRDAEPAGAL